MATAAATSERKGRRCLAVYKSGRDLSKDVGAISLLRVKGFIVPYVRT
jgi:hypothetical protein